MNTPSGVLLEVQGPEQRVTEFVPGIEQNSPPLAVITAVRVEEVPLSEESGFDILQSGGSGGEVQIAPDCDVCPDCLAELFDPADRRYRYPFINCTNCGPRYTIIKGVPMIGRYHHGRFSHVRRLSFRI
jgi:hydrogenase maturation protein HypF